MSPSRNIGGSSHKQQMGKEADDIVFKRNNSKEKNGAVGILTNNLIDRTKYYEEAVVLSLIPFIKNELFV